MKAIVAQFIFETNTFNPAESEIDIFENGGTLLDREPAVRAWSADAPTQLTGSVAELEATC